MYALTGDDGTSLHLAPWDAPRPQRPAVLMVHGLGEHMGRYAEVAAQLRTAGCRVLGYDHRGHGQSGGARGSIPADDSLLRDLARVIDAVRRDHAGPLLLLGHSLGGAVAARFVAEGTVAQPAAWHRPVEGLILSSPALALDVNPLQHLLLWLGRLTPDLAAANGLRPAWISHDPQVVKAYVDDPLVHDRVTPRLGRFLLEAGEFVRAAAPRWQVPTLLLWAGADRCVAPRGSAAFAQAAPTACLESRCFDGLFHEIFNEPEKAQVIQAMLHWIAHRWPQAMDTSQPAILCNTP